MDKQKKNRELEKKDAEIKNIKKVVEDYKEQMEGLIDLEELEYVPDNVRERTILDDFLEILRSKKIPFVTLEQFIKTLKGI